MIKKRNKKLADRYWKIVKGMLCLAVGLFIILTGTALMQHIAEVSNEVIVYVYALSILLSAIYFIAQTIFYIFGEDLFKSD